MTEGPQTTFETDEHKVGYAVHSLMSSVKDVADLTEDQFLASLVRNEYEDIELASARLQRVLAKVRGA